MAIPTSTVLLATAGGVLIYAGLSGVNPLAALREIASGHPTAIRNSGGTYGTAAGSVAGGLIDDSLAAINGLPPLPAACERFSHDKYSQTNRWANGYSDCSSFVGKGLKVIGIKPPAGSTTMSYYTSKEWQAIPASEVKAGDLACGTTHVVVCYGDGTAIGQQNPKRNVQKGKVKDLMYGTGPFVYLRYVGSMGSGDKTGEKSSKQKSAPKSAPASMEV